jgi:hypothetical protein
VLPTNRSMPRSTVIPVLTYEDVGAAIEWLHDAFGFRERWRVGGGRRRRRDHRTPRRTAGVRGDGPRRSRRRPLRTRT